MGRAAIEALLAHLAAAQQVASTQHQALRVLGGLYGNVRNTPLDFPIDAVCAKKPTRVPTALTTEATTTRSVGNIPWFLGHKDWPPCEE